MGTENYGDTSMRIINIIIFVVIGGMWFVVQLLCKKANEKQKSYQQFIRKHWYLFLILLLANAISFVMTFDSKNKEIFVERNGYGGEEKEIEVLLEKQEEQERWQIPVGAKMLTEEQLQERVESAFTYLETHMQADNPSLKEVRSNLDYSLDYMEFPFDAEFVADQFLLIDEEGVITNKKEELLDLGYSEQDLKNGIHVILEVTLWYEEQSFTKEYELVIFPKQENVVQEAFSMAKQEIEKVERAAAYEDGFVIPIQMGDVTISLVESDKISPGRVLLAGFVLVVLLLLREQENNKQYIQKRKECLLRSYPWFVNELLLLMGAGMQTRNILALLVREYEETSNLSDYRKPLIEEIKVAVQAIELGMSEEQVYYKLGRRIGLPSYIKIMTLLEQNIKRGGKGIGLVFEQEELQALEERKNMAKKLGEEAGTKLLGPMVLLLLTIMMMIMLPAFWGFA